MCVTVNNARLTRQQRSKDCTIAARAHVVKFDVFDNLNSIIVAL